MGQELVQYKIIQQIHLERFSGKEHAFSHRACVCVCAHIYEHVPIHKRPLRAHCKSRSSFLHCEEADCYRGDISVTRLSTDSS